MTPEETKLISQDYPLIPLSDIEWEARCVAVSWVEGYEKMGFDIEQKHKLASDLMNYARHQIEKANIGLADYVRSVEAKDAEIAELKAAGEKMAKAILTIDAEISATILEDVDIKTIINAIDQALSAWNALTKKAE